MATYMELYGLKSDDELKHKIHVATWVEAQVIRVEPVDTPNHTNRLVWAEQALTIGGGKADQMFPAVLAANKDATVETIQAASDADIQAAVAAAVDLVATG